MDKYPVTPQGADKMREELHRLKSVERPSIVSAISTARDHGDLSENAEYHAAKERQSFIEGRIKDLEHKIARFEVIDPSKMSGSRVAFGATVSLCNSDTDEKVTYRILGADEADIKLGSISISSPLARALIGKEPGDEVLVRMPGGERTYEILDVQFG